MYGGYVLRQYKIFRDNDMHKMYGSDNDAKYITIRKGQLLYSKENAEKGILDKRSIIRSLKHMTQSM